MIFWETGYFPTLKRLEAMDMRSSFFFSLRVWRTPMPCLFTFLSSWSASRLWIGTCVVYPHTYINIIGNIIKHNLRTSMNDQTNFFIKICISHTLFSKGLMFLWCVRDGGRQGQTAILTQLLLLTIACCDIFKNPLTTSSASWLGLLNQGRWGPQPSVCKLALTLAFLSPTNSMATSICLYSFIMPTCFRFFTQVHLWLTTWS